MRQRPLWNEAMSFRVMENVQNIKTDQIGLEIDERNKIIIICFGFIKMAVTDWMKVVGHPKKKKNQAVESDADVCDVRL